MPTLDAACYPHIFEAVFAFAVADGDVRIMSRLRGVCREVRDHIDRIWYHAIVDDRGIHDLGVFRDRPVARVSLPAGAAYPALLDIRLTGVW